MRHHAGRPEVGVGQLQPVREREHLRSNLEMGLAQPPTGSVTEVRIASVDPRSADERTRDVDAVHPGPLVDCLSRMRIHAVDVDTPIFVVDLRGFASRRRRSRCLRLADPRPDAVAVPTRYFAVGITNSAPLAMLAGQRCMIDFCLV